MQLLIPLAIDRGKPVDVYYNYRLKLWSVRQTVNIGGVMRRRVVAHLRTIWLRDATFVVREAGRQRVIETKQKNVHAWVRGMPVVDWVTLSPGEVPTEATYNPYKYATFMRKVPLEPITSSRFVSLSMMPSSTPTGTVHTPFVLAVV